jgi:hypothetical protein
MAKRSIKKLRAAVKSSSSSSPAVKQSPKMVSVGKKQELGKKAKLRAKRNDTVDLAKLQQRKGNSKGKRTQIQLSSLESGIQAQHDDERIQPAASNNAQSNKLKGSVAVREAERMKLVMNNAEFRANPFGAMQQHLQHMIQVKQQQTAITKKTGTKKK